MEVLASVVFFKIVIAIWLVVEYHVSRNWNIPENVNMSEYDYEPV